MVVVVIVMMVLAIATAGGGGLVEARGAERKRSTSGFEFVVETGREVGEVGRVLLVLATTSTSTAEWSNCGFGDAAVYGVLGGSLVMFVTGS